MLKIIGTRAIISAVSCQENLCSVNGAYGLVLRNLLLVVAGKKKASENINTVYDFWKLFPVQWQKTISVCKITQALVVFESVHQKHQFSLCAHR
jgi:hypothetical protein